MDRRQFVRSGSAAAVGLALFGSSSLRSGHRQQAGRYGALGAVDANGIALPPGFRSRVVATTGLPVTGSDEYVWHQNPDGGATFALDDGGWVYVSNDESGNGRGGVSMLRFDRAGTTVAARQILAGTNRNCGGGAMPWGSWLSCEEVDEGLVFECDPIGLEPARARPALGVFKHEAAAADPAEKTIYLTEDEGDGLLYRFTPTNWGDLSVGALEALVADDDKLGWQQLPDPQARSAATRNQLPNAVRFDGGEGAWFDAGTLYFTTKGDNRVWRWRPALGALDTIYDIDTAPNPVLSGVDNVTVGPAGDVFVCEDGGNMEIVMLDTDGTVAPFLRVDVSGSELAGVAFDPSGTRMYFSSQRNPGTTFEVTGPFAGARTPVASAEQASTAQLADRQGAKARIKTFRTRPWAQPTR